MSFAKKIIHGASWLSAFRFLSQIYSWVITIQVARLLSPDDYALMAMSTILTGYAMMFSNLGLGNAIIYNKQATKKELSSVFWFAAFLGLFFGLLSLVLAYPTSYIFNNKQLIPITQAVSILFILNALLIVPLSIQNRDFQFKKIGLIEMLSTFIGSTTMLIFAFKGFGVWTLILGSITLSASKLIITYYFTREWPMFHYSFKEVKHFLSFGVLTSIGTSLKYVFEKSDRFFAGRAWSTTLLGYYELALDLSQMPVAKITSIINQVSFPVLSEFKNNKEKFNRFFLDLNKILFLFVSPFFIGGFVVGEELIKVILNPKWEPIIPIFKILCLVQIFTIIANINNYVHGAKGKPQLYLFFNGILAVTMVIAFGITVKYGYSVIWIPWATVYVVLCIGWILFTLKKIEITLLNYLGTIALPSAGLVLLFLVISFSDVLLKNVSYPTIAILAIKVVIGAIFYSLWLFVTERNFLLNLLKKIR
jgi:O-antigen/teichoic acid export membrane protein